MPRIVNLQCRYAVGLRHRREVKDAFYKKVDIHVAAQNKCHLPAKEKRSS